MGDPVGQLKTQQSSLSDWAAPYVTDVIGKGAALGELPYVPYTGTLSAGQSGLQTQAYQGIAGLGIPTAQMGAYTPSSFTAGNTAQRYMNPYLQASLEPQIAEAQRQAEIQRMANASRLSQAGAYGGSRQAVMDSESQRNYLRNVADITQKGYNTAYGVGQDQFNLEQDRLQSTQQDTNRYGLDALQQMSEFGDTQRKIEAEGLAQDYAQFKEERDFPYKQVTYQQSLLQGLPVEAMAREYLDPSALAEIMGYGGTLAEIIRIIKGDD